MSVFGIPFFGAGIFMILSSLGVIPIQNADGAGRFVAPTLSLMGVLFTVVGGGLVFGRSWTTVDATQRAVLKQWGLLVPMGGTAYRLDGYHPLVLLEFRRGDSDTADQFSVGLRARAGKDLPLFSSTQYAESRARAAAVAELLHFDIVDMSTDHAVQMPASQVDQSLQHRLRMEHRHEEKVARPASLKSEITAHNGEVRIVVPVRRSPPAVLLVYLFPMVMAASFFSPLDGFFRATRTPDPFAWVFLGFFLFGFVVIPALVALNTVLKSRRGRTIVTVSSAGIRLDERRVWKTRTLASISASDVLDVDYGTGDSALRAARRGAELVISVLGAFVKGSGITIKTRHGLSSFGDGLDDEEIRYLHFVVRRALVGYGPT
jgi:hypothetical protein